MAIQSKRELLETVKTLMGASYDKVTSDGFANAIDQACNELNWEPPQTDPKKCFWMIERAKRFVIYVLLIESAHKFRYKQIFLQQRFENYYKLIDMMDKEFEKALEADPGLFDTGTYSTIADYISNGFQYDSVGRDITYSGWE